MTEDAPTSCGEFQIALESRRLETLAPEAEAQLAAHVAGCTDCRAFEAFREKTEAIMTGDTTVNQVDWERIRRTMQDYGAIWRDSLLLGLLLAAGMSPLIVFSVGVPNANPALIFAVLAGLPFAYGLRYAMDRKRIQQARVAAVDKEMFMPFYRQHVGVAVRQVRRASYHFVLAALWILGIGLLIAPHASTTTWICRAILLGEGIGLAIYYRRVQLRRLERVREMLE